MSRFIKPTYKIIATDDVDYTLIGMCKKAQKAKPQTCVVIAVNQCYSRKVANTSHIPCSVLFITTHMVWGARGKAMSAAVIKSATLTQGDENEDELAMSFASDLVEFLDGYGNDLSQVLERHFVQEG